MTSTGLRVEAYRWMTLFAVSTLLLIGAAGGCRGPALIASSSSPDGSGAAMLLAIVVAPLWIKAITRAWSLSSALVRNGALTDRWRAIAWYACIDASVVSLPFAAASKESVWPVVVFASAVLMSTALPAVSWVLAPIEERRRGTASATSAENANE